MKKKTKPDKQAIKPVQLNLTGRGKQMLPAAEAAKHLHAQIQKGPTPFLLPALLDLTQQLPGYQQAWLLLFDFLNRMGDMPRLKQEAERCLSSKPRFVPALVNLSVALKTEQRHNESLSLLQKAAKLEPSNSELYNHMGVLYKELGETERAKSAFQRCIQLKPNQASAIWNRSDIAGVLPSGEYQAIEQLLHKPTTPDRSKAMLHYALARSDEANQDYAKEFAHVDAGAKLMRSLVNYDHQAELTLSAQIREAFDSSLFSREESLKTVNPTDNTNSRPIFICGLPRSGTTLVEQILSRHPKITAGDELNDLPLACSKRLQAKGIKQAYPLWVDRLEEQDWHKIGEGYLASTQALQKTPYFTDKNLQNYKAIGLIRKALPNARIIVCQRSPMDVIWGCYRQFFSNGLVFSYDLQELAETWREFELTIQHWQHLDLPFHTLCYEDMITDPETSIRNLLSYLELEWDEQCLAFHQSERAIKTTSAIQVRQPLTQSFIARWKRYEEQLAPIAKWVQTEEPTD